MNAAPATPDQYREPAQLPDLVSVRYAILSLVIGIITYLPVVYGPFLLKERGVISPLTISLVLMGNSVGGAISSMLYGPFKKRLSINAAFAICVGWIGACMLVAVLVPGVGGAATGCCCSVSDWDGRRPT